MSLSVSDVYIINVYIINVNSENVNWEVGSLHCYLDWVHLCRLQLFPCSNVFIDNLENLVENQIVKQWLQMSLGTFYSNMAG